MSWMAVAIGGGALLGYLGNQQTNKQAGKAAKNQGYVDMTTTTSVDPKSQFYRDAGMEAAYEALFGRKPGGDAPLGTFPYDPNDPRNPKGPLTQGRPGPGPGGPGSGGRPDTGEAGYPDQYTPIASPSLAPGTRINKKGKVVKVKGGGGAGKGAGKGGDGGEKFVGMSGETDEIRRRLMEELPAENKGLFESGEGFIEDTLAGDTRNPLIGRSVDAAEAIAEDPGLAEYIETLKGGASGKATKGDRRVNMGTVNAAYGGFGGGGGVGGGPAGGSATGTDLALKKLVAGELPAGWEGMESGISRKVNEGRAANIRELRARAVGSGFYGGDLYKDLETGAIAKGDMELADSLAAARFDAYKNALGLGTQYDLGMADIGSRERSAAANAAAASGAAGADIASRERLAQLGMWGDALELGQRGRSGKAGALGDLAGLTSADQRDALANVGAITSGRRADLGAAGDLSLGADANRNAWRASQNQLAGVRAGVNLGRAELAFDKERFYDPFARLSAYSDVLGGLYGGLGSETTRGRDTRNASPPPYSSPWGGALTGAAIGGQAAGAYRR